MLGTLDGTEDGRFSLRFEREYPCARATVWQAITRPDRLSRWSDQMIDYGRSRLDFTEGANLLFVPLDGHLFQAQNGQVIRVDPPLLLEYTRASQLLRWRLEAAGEDGCRLALTVLDHLRGILVGTAPQRHAELDRLHAVLCGGRPTAVDLNRLQREYERELG
jgi:hypothetical protein